MATLRKRLLAMYDSFPFHQHPYWKGVLAGEICREGIFRAEVQHWLRTRAGQPLRRVALDAAEKISPAMFTRLLETYLEECTADETGPSHLDLIVRLVAEGGYDEASLRRAIPTPGNSAAIALYKDIGQRGAGCHMIGAGAVEHYYCKLCPGIFRSYTEQYGIPAAAAETYRIHGPMDEEHAERAFAVLDEAVRLHGEDTLLGAVRDAFVATSLHYDGMLQAASGSNAYWDGAS